jgi:eukaryotic-like serine/threonine-protein kinase
MTLTAQQFVEVVRRSQLVDADRLKTACEALRAELKSVPPDQHLTTVADAFARQALVTPWQLKNLLTGKSRGYFLGNYKLLEHVGRGGMGTVYLAEHTKLKRRVAVKVLPASWANEPTFLERFEREARAIASLDHPHIVRAYDFDSVEGAHFLVLEFVDGKNLATLVKNAPQPLSITDVVHSIAQAAAGLEYAHQRGIVHRDVKPSNLLIDVSGNVKLLDLGLARWNQEDVSSVTVANNQSLLGTADYLAPEQALNSHSADHRADIYGLGCTLYFALVGHSPFHEGTIGQKIAQHQIAERPQAIDLRPDVPPWLNDACLRMMAIRPEERFQSAQEVWEELKQIRVTTPPREPADAETSESEAPAQVLIVDPPLSVIQAIRGRPQPRIKRPPIAFWIFLGLLAITAAVLGFLVYQRFG